MNIIYRIEYGSVLYGTSTEKSDKDFISFYLPTYVELMTGKMSMNVKSTSTSDKSRKNTAEDIDERFVSIQKFAQDFYAGKQYATEVAFAVYEKWRTKNEDDRRSLSSKEKVFSTMCAMFCYDVVSTRNVLDENAIAALSEQAKENAHIARVATDRAVGADIAFYRKKAYSNTRLISTSDELRIYGELRFPMLDAEILRNIKTGVDIENSVNQILNTDRTFMSPNLIRNNQLTVEEFDKKLVKYIEDMYDLCSELPTGSFTFIDREAI